MTVVGYTLMCEQAGPKDLVRDVQQAEEAGFEFAVISDLCQIGGDHHGEFIEWWKRSLGPALGA